MAGYVIGSQKGKDIANGLKTGGTYKASDGSTWTKNKNGIVSVTTKNGGYTANALSGGGSSSTTQSGSKGGGSSAIPKPSTVNTNTSYNGSYLSIDPNHDYEADVINYSKAGNYKDAAYAEVARNAKLTYLNQGDKVTNRYADVYKQSNGNGTNGKGGTVYADKYNNFGALPDNWSAARINGVAYTKDKAGHIYQNVGNFANGNVENMLVGDSYNKDTNELRYSNRDDATQAAYNQFIGSGGNKNITKEYALDNGLIDNGYIDALMNGTTGNYSNTIADGAKAERARALKAAAQSNNSFEDDNDNEEAAPAPEKTAAVLTDNSFESDVDADNYNDFINQTLSRQRINIQ